MKFSNFEGEFVRKESSVKLKFFFSDNYKRRMFIYVNSILVGMMNNVSLILTKCPLDLRSLLDVQMQKKFDANQIQCSQLILQNQELKGKCDLLQEKLDSLERTNIRLIQRWTQQVNLSILRLIGGVSSSSKDLRSLAERTGWVSTDNRFLLREEILLLKQKLYHVYDDLATLFNRNHSLEITFGEQKQQLLSYKQQYKYHRSSTCCLIDSLFFFLSDLKQSAQQLLHDLDKRSMEERIKRFLNNIVLDQQQTTAIPIR